MVPLISLRIFSVDTMCVNKREVTVHTKTKPYKNFYFSEVFKLRHINKQFFLV